MNEEAAAQAYLREYLEADTTLMGSLSGGVWTRSVGISERFPIVKIDRDEAEDQLAFGANGPTRVWADITYLIRAVIHWTGSGHPDWTVADELADQLDTLLHGHQAVTADLDMHIFRVETFTDETVEDGDLFLQSGGMYRVRVREA